MAEHILNRTIEIVVHMDYADSSYISIIDKTEQVLFLGRNYHDNICSANRNVSSIYLAKEDDLFLSIIIIMLMQSLEASNISYKYYMQYCWSLSVLLVTCSSVY